MTLEFFVYCAYVYLFAVPATILWVFRKSPVTTT